MIADISEYYGVAAKGREQVAAPSGRSDCATHTGTSPHGHGLCTGKEFSLCTEVCVLCVQRCVLCVCAGEVSCLCTRVCVVCAQEK